MSNTSNTSNTFHVLTQGIRFHSKYNPRHSTDVATHSNNNNNNNDTPNEVARRRLRIEVDGAKPIPALLMSFTQLSEEAPKYLSRNIENSRFKEPTPIQMQAIPILQSGKDVLAVAPTGTGKTAAFLLPILLQSNTSPFRGIRALVIVPTHELADQILREFTWLSANSNVKGVVLNTKTKVKVVRAARAVAHTDEDEYGLDLVVTTPMILVDMIQTNEIECEAMSNIHFLVLDEADRLFEMGFVEQLDTILASCDPPCHAQQRALFSATMPPRVQALAQSVLRNHCKVTVGTVNAAADTVNQNLIFCGNEQGKLVAIRRLVREGALAPPCLIFVQTIDRAKELASELAYDGLAVDALHGDRSATDRDNVVTEFRQGKLWFLIATDILSRGVDFRGVNSVVNYDFPSTAISYIHRVGRCGRSGRPGKAFTFFTETDMARLRPIANVLRISGCEVPDWMLALKRVSNKQFAPVIQERIGGGLRRTDDGRKKKPRVKKEEQEEE